MSKKLTVAVVGATGAVGREMLKTLHDRQFPATEVRAFASAVPPGPRCLSAMTSWWCRN